MATESNTSTLEEILNTIISNGKFQIEVVTTSPGPTDYLITILPALISAAIMYLTYYIFKERMNDFKVQLKLSKDAERYYEAADLCFNFFDSAGLLFSMNEKKSIRHQKGMEDDLGFEDKFRNSNNNFFEAIGDSHKAEFIFKSIKLPAIAKKIESHREQIIIMRKEQAAAIESKNSADLLNIQNGYQELQKSFRASKEELFDLIVTLKPN